MSLGRRRSLKKLQFRLGLEIIILDGIIHPKIEKIEKKKNFFLLIFFFINNNK